jgi:lambda family phage portal protein
MGADRTVEASSSPYALNSSGAGRSPAVSAFQNGDKFAGGFGATELLTMDYWTLRARSSQLFTKNLYARGIIRRMVTNEINTGLGLESIPESSLLGMDKNELSRWADDVEKRYEIYGDNIMDFKGVNSAGKIEQIARREALIEGDILVIMRQDSKTGNPQVQLVPGNKVRTPITEFNENIVEGVELDKDNNHVAFHVLQDDNTYKRIAAKGRKTGRKRAWLMYAIDKRHDDVRGEPLLSIILQSLNEIDKYRDAAQRKAVINSLLAMFIEKGEERIGSMPMTGAATSNSTFTAESSIASQESAAEVRRSNFTMPGVILDELQYGEKPHAFKSETDIDFGKFEEIIVQAMAWCLEIPPEILRQSFSSNYSASQASINEYKLYLNPTRLYFADQFNNIIYREWLISEILTGRITAGGFLDALRSRDVYTVGAWFKADWAGAIKPSSDLAKMVKAYKEAVDAKFITRARASRELFGMKWDRIIEQLGFENQKVVEADRPLMEFRQEFEVTDDEETSTEIVEVAGQVQALQENVIELSEHIDVKN